MKPDSRLSSVVLPAPVPPETTMFSRALHDRAQHLRDRRRETAELDQVVDRQQLDREAPDRQHRRRRAPAAG